MKKKDKKPTFQVWKCPECEDITLVETRPFQRHCSLCGYALNLVDEGNNIQEFLLKSWEK